MAAVLLMLTAINSVQMNGVIYGPNEDFEVEKKEGERLIELKVAHLKGEVQAEVKGQAAKVTKASAAKAAKIEAEKQAQFAKDEAARRAAEKQAEADAAANDAEVNINDLSIEDLRAEIELYDGVYSQEDTKENLILILTKCIEEDEAK